MNTLPREIIVDILKDVPFKELFGSCSLVNSEFRKLIWKSPIPFPIAADFSIRASNRFSSSSSEKALDFFTKVDGKRVVKLNLSNLSKIPRKDYTTILKACPNVKVLIFKRNLELSDEEAQRIPEFCPQIEILSLQLTSNIKDIGFIFELKNLKELNLKGCVQLGSENIQFAKLIERNTKTPLSRLQLPKYIDNGILKNSGSLFPQLETLLIPGYNFITEASLENLPNSVTDLNLRNISLLSSAHMELISKQCPKLKKLDLYSTKIYNDSLNILLTNCNELEFLILHMDFISNSGLKMLGRYRSLKRLIMVHPFSSITDEGFSALAGNQTQLEELSLLIWNKVSVSYKKLIEVNAPTLKKLTLKKVPEEDSLLVAVAKCSNLTHLVLETSESEEKLKFLFSSLPNLKFLYIKSPAIENNIQFLVQQCPKLKKLVIESSFPSITSGTLTEYAHISLIQTNGWNADDFIPESSAITMKEFDLL